jgi:manganese oxidase
MGGMFSVVKVREGLARDDYKDPGWYKHPPGTVAHEWNGATPVAQRPATPTTQPAPATGELRARKPVTHKH